MLLGCLGVAATDGAPGGVGGTGDGLSLERENAELFINISLLGSLIGNIHQALQLSFAESVFG